MIPKSFEEWRNCIINDCKINLTKEFAEQRLNVYKNAENNETKLFIKLYGKKHLNNIIYWFKLV